jgi:hypothetical protein
VKASPTPDSPGKKTNSISRQTPTRQGTDRITKLAGLSFFQANQVLEKLLIIEIYIQALPFNPHITTYF